MKRFKIAILGSSSFLAKSFKDFSEKNHDLVYFGRTNSSGLKNFETFDYPNQNFEELELHRFDAVINFMSAGVQSNMAVSTSDIYDINTFFPIKLIAELNKSYKGKLITFGSYFEIGNCPEQKFFSEEELIGSSYRLPNDYSISKRMLTTFSRNKVQNFAHYHLILSTIYGMGEQENRLVPYILNSEKSGKKVSFSSGNQVRQYVHVNDVAQLLINIIENNFDPGIYNVTNEREVVIRDLISMIFNKLNKPLPQVFGDLNTRDESMKYLLLTGNKAMEKLKWQASTTLETGIENYIRDYNKNV